MYYVFALSLFKTDFAQQPLLEQRSLPVYVILRGLESAVDPYTSDSKEIVSLEDNCRLSTMQTERNYSVLRGVCH